MLRSSPSAGTGKTIAVHIAHSDADLRKIHATHDRDGDGRMTVSEFLVAMKNMEILQETVGSRADAVAAFFNEVDEDRSGSMSAPEFITAYHRLLKDGILDADSTTLDDLRDRFGAALNVTVNLVRWYSPELQRGPDGPVSFVFTPTDIERQRKNETLPAWTEMESFVAKADGVVGLWIDVVGPRHHVIVTWLERLGLDGVSRSDEFLEEGVWFRGDLRHSHFPLPPILRKGDSEERDATFDVATQAPYVGWVARDNSALFAPQPATQTYRITLPKPSPNHHESAIIEPMWLANTPFSLGMQPLIPAWCPRRLGGRSSRKHEGIVAKRLSNCAKREGLVFVSPYGSDTHFDAETVPLADVIGAALQSRFVSHYIFPESSNHVSLSQRRKFLAEEAARSPERTPNAALSDAATAKIETLLDSINLGGGFSLASKSQLIDSPPLLVKSKLGVFRIRARPEIVLTLRDRRQLPRVAGGPGTPGSKYEQTEVLDEILGAYRNMILSATTPLADARALPVGTDDFRSQLMTPHRGPQILSSAIIDSVATRFNDLPLKLCEHWEAVLSSAISHAALSLHQRHINRFVGISASLLENAKRLAKQIDAIIHFDEKSLAESGGARQRDYVSAFSRRCKAYLERCERLEDRITALKDQYRTSLDESRNWMTTALSACRLASHVPSRNLL